MFAKPFGQAGRGRLAGQGDRVGLARGRGLQAGERNVSELVPRLTYLPLAPRKGVVNTSVVGAHLGS